MKNVKLLFVFLSLIVLASMSAVAAPIPLGIEWVEVEGTQLDPSGQSVLREEFRREDELNVRIRLSAPVRVEDVVITAFISGYEFGEISDSVRIHRIDPGRALTTSLKLQLPDLIDDGDYKLRLLVTDKNSDTLVQEYDIAVGLDEHNLVIDDVIFYESTTVRPGDSLYSLVRVRNRGSRDYDNVRVTVSVPELDIRTADFLNEVEAGDIKSSPELFMRVPLNAKPGSYEVVVDVDYHHQRTTTKTYMIEVVEEEKAEAEAPKTVVSASTQPQRVSEGSTAVYPLTISNLGSDSKTYTLTIESAGQWADFRIDPSNLVLLKGYEARTIYLHVTPNEDAQESNVFVVTIDDGKDKSQVAFQTDVTFVEEDTSFRRGLEIGLIVLVVLLVVIGLVVAFTRFAARDDDDEEDDEEGTQTYY